MSDNIRYHVAAGSYRVDTTKPMILEAYLGTLPAPAVRDRAHRPSSVAVSMILSRWDMRAYNESSVDSFCNMYTYSNWTSLFTRELMDDLNHFTGKNVDKIGLGLDSQYRPTLTDEELQVRFDLIDQLGIRELDIWVEKVPDTWLPYLRKFLGAKDH